MNWEKVPYILFTLIFWARLEQKAARIKTLESELLEERVNHAGTRARLVQRSLLEKFLGPQLDKLEAVLQQTTTGKYAGHPPDDSSALHHLGKAIGHIEQSKCGVEIDADTGVPHVILAALRLLMAQSSREAREKL